MIEVKYLRAWLAFLVLQSLGSAFTLTTNTNTALFTSIVDDFGKRALAILMVMAALIRLFLVKSFESFELQMLHIIISFILCVHSLAEMVHYEIFQISPAATLNCTLNGITALFFVFYVYLWIEPPKVAKEQRRSGRLFAKHYMEGDLLNSPDTPEIRELKKRA